MLLTAFGLMLFGKVDRVPELGSISTRFFHINYFPLIPLGSYLVTGADKEDGIKVPISWKSILVAWSRAVLIVAFAVAVLIAVIGFFEDELSEALTAGSISVIPAGLFSLLHFAPGIGRATSAKEESMRRMLGLTVDPTSGERG